jgi:hypothetical protein
MADQKPLYQRTWFIVVMSILLLAIVSGALTNNESSPEDQQSEIIATSEPEETPTEESASTPAPSSSPSSDPNSPDSIAYFIFSSEGQFMDLEKDIQDAIGRAENDQTIRLLGNVLEFSFNLGQLRALDPPSVIADQWNDAIVALDDAISASSDAATEFVSGEVSLSAMLDALYSVQNAVDGLRGIAGLVE